MQDEGQKEQQPQAAGWVFNPGAAPQPAYTNATPQVPAQPQAAPASPQEDTIAWTASEYIGNPKNVSWFTLLGAAAMGVAIVVYFLTKDVVSTVVIIILGIMVGIFAARQPRVLEYSLDRSGVHIGLRFYPYNYFKSFSVVEEGVFSHISLLPLKRLSTPMALHYSPADGDKITSTLADYLPFEEHKRDMIENFSRKVRF